MSDGRLQGCEFEVVMLDTRTLADEPSFMGMLVPDQYVSLTAVLNYAYAKRFGYNFSFVHVKKLRQNFSSPWHRVFYFNDLLVNESNDQRCKWYLHVDTDAFVRPPWKPMPAVISDLGARYHIGDDVGAIFAQEQIHPPMMPWTLHAVNAGVYLFQRNARSRHLFAEWVAAASDDPLLKATWPAEQGVLTELRFPGRYHTGLKLKHARLRRHDNVAADIALVNMTEMNSPWGRFVEHIWSGPGSNLRAHGFMDALQAIGDAEASKFRTLLVEARRHMVSWTPTS